jgi:hypothetical protein
VGGKHFDLPEQVVVLLQKDFEAMSKTKSEQFIQPVAIADKGKAMASVEPGTESAKSVLMQDLAESSCQGAERKEGSGKSPYCFRCKTKGHATTMPVCSVTFVRVRITSRCGAPNLGQRREHR